MLETARRYEFRAGIVTANAPRESGVYALYRGAELLLIDETDNIFACLMNLVAGSGLAVWDLPAPDAWAFEVCSPGRRRSRLMHLVFRYKPLRTRRPEFKFREL